jgi:hypothetical protein
MAAARSSVASFFMRVLDQEKRLSNIHRYYEAHRVVPPKKPLFTEKENNSIVIVSALN